jgi:hypothetical protein
MKNNTHSLVAEMHATNALHQILQWVELNCTKMASATKSQLVLECLIEVNEERKFIAAQ